MTPWVRGLGFADSNGTTICDMARSAQSNADPNCQNNPNAQACDLGPGDFPGTGPIAAQPPAPSAADIRVGIGQV